MKREQIILWVTPGEKAALKSHAERASQIAGIQISVSNTVVTTMKQIHDDIREEATQIDKEWKSNGRKYKKQAKLGSAAQG